MNAGSDERDAILSRIREALRAPAPLPHGRLPGPDSAEMEDDSSRISDWLPAVGSTFDERASLFARNAADLRAVFLLDDSPQRWRDRLRELAIAGNWKKIAAHRADLVASAAAELGLAILWTDDGFDTAELEKCDASITACDALIAQTGSVLLTSASAGGRSISVLPPHHVVLARREQLVADLPAAFALLKRRYAPNYPSFMSLVTGPSRTGDIERILVLGAHGPRQLTILCA